MQGLLALRSTHIKSENILMNQKLESDTKAMTVRIGLLKKTLYKTMIIVIITEMESLSLFLSPFFRFFLKKKR